MADSSVPITAGAGTPIRVLTALGAGVAGQQVVTLADPNGNLLGPGLAASTAVVTATAAAATAVTATLTAPAAGLFHYITHIRIERFLTAAGTGAGTAVLTGGTNHGLVFNLPTDAATIGTQSVPVDYRPTTPLRATAAATATTVTTPTVAGTVYRITVTYFTAP